MSKPQVDEQTLRTMQALLHQPPKTHDEMKLGKPRRKVEGSPAVKRGRKPKGKVAMTNAESKRQYNAERKASGYKTAFEEIAASKKAPTK